MRLFNLIFMNTELAAPWIICLFFFFRLGLGVNLGVNVNLMQLIFPVDLVFLLDDAAEVNLFCFHLHKKSLVIRARINIFTFVMF